MLTCEHWVRCLVIDGNAFKSHSYSNVILSLGLFFLDGGFLSFIFERFADVLELPVKDSHLIAQFLFLLELAVSLAHCFDGLLIIHDLGFESTSGLPLHIHGVDLMRQQDPCLFDLQLVLAPFVAVVIRVPRFIEFLIDRLYPYFVKRLLDLLVNLKSLQFECSLSLVDNVFYHQKLHQAIDFPGHDDAVVD